MRSSISFKATTNGGSILELSDLISVESRSTPCFFASKASACEFTSSVFTLAEIPLSLLRLIQM